MPNYNVRSCTSGEVFVISSDEIVIPISSVIQFNVSETDYCGVVESVNSSGSNDGVYIGPYESCCDCVHTIITDISSLIFTICGSETTFNIDLLYFCNESNLFPNLGDVFQFLDSRGNLICATHTGYSSNRGESGPEPVDGPFENCWLCEPHDIPPRSANTETTVCVICCDCGASASTINQVVVPHPVWTDGYSAEVTQMNMITIGGNGLNS